MANVFDSIYKDLVNAVLNDGTDCSSRGLNYRQLFGVDFKVDLREQFPLLTLRRLPIKGIVSEFLWHINGGYNVNNLGNAKHFWDFLVEDEDEGVLRGSYGRAWRAYPSAAEVNAYAYGREHYSAEPIDQLGNVIDQLCKNPTSRRIQMITEIPHLDNYAMNPCHPMVMFSSDGEYLDMLVVSRSNDLAFGTPIDVVVYSLMQLWLAKIAGLTARFHKHSIANLHFYDYNKNELVWLCERESGSVGVVDVRLNPENDFDPQIKIMGYSSPTKLVLSRGALQS